MEVLDKVTAGCGLTGLLEVYNDQGYSDYLVVYLRLSVIINTVHVPVLFFPAVDSTEVGAYDRHQVHMKLQHITCCFQLVQTPD